MAPSSSQMNPVCVHALISGRVQGVGYRFTTREKALDLGLVGWVRNLPSGQVEAMIQGDRTSVDSMVQWLHAGPPAARVDSVHSRETSMQAFTHFEIRR